MYGSFLIKVFPVLTWLFSVTWNSRRYRYRHYATPSLIPLPGAAPAKIRVLHSVMSNWKADDLLCYLAIYSRFSFETLWPKNPIPFNPPIRRTGTEAIVSWKLPDGTLSWLKARRCRFQWWMAISWGRAADIVYGGDIHVHIHIRAHNIIRNIDFNRHAVQRLRIVWKAVQV